MQSDRMKKRQAFLSVSVLAGILGSWLVSAKLLERREFQGQVDSVSGYRCRFTVSSSWTQLSDAVHDSTQDHEQFRLPPQSISLRTWLHAHFGFPSADTADASDFYLPEGIEFSCRRVTEPSPVTPPNAYPDLSSAADTFKSAQKHLRIDGYPTTRIDFIQSFDLSHKVLMLIATPRGRISVVLIGTAEPAHAAEIDQELQEILASFHIDTVRSERPESGHSSVNSGQKSVSQREQAFSGNSVRS